MPKSILEQRRTANINKLIKLYDIYYEKAQTDVSAARFFFEFQKELFSTYGTNDDEMTAILKSMRIKEDD